MAQSTTEIYTILVQSTGTADVRALSKELEKSNRAMQEVQRATKGVATATNDVSKSQKMAALQWQNAGYQVQDFLVQVSAGTGAMRALGQQLPQLLSGFGLWGVALGTAAAGLGAIAPMLFNMKDAAKEATNATEALTEATNALYASTEAAAQPIEKFRAEYGAFADTAKGLTDIQLQIDTVQAEFALKRAQTALDDFALSGEKLLKSWQRTTGEIVNLQIDMFNKVDTAGDLNEQLVEAQENLKVFEDEIKDVTGLGATDFATLTRSIQAIDAAIQANDVEGLIKAYRQAMEAIGDAGDTIGAEVAARLEASVNAGLNAIRIANAEIATINATAAAGLEMSRTEIEKMEAKLADLRTMLQRVRDEPNAFAPDAYKGIIAQIQQTVLELVKLREESQKPFGPGKDVEAAWLAINAALADSVTAQDKAREKADELQAALDLVDAGIIQLSPDKVDIIRAALDQATTAANAMSGAVLRIQNSIDSLNAGTLRNIAMTMARIQGFSMNVTQAIGDTTDAAAELRDALAEAGDDPVKRAEALRLFSEEAQARRDNLASLEEYEAVNDRIAESERAAAKAAKEGSKAKSKASKDSAKAAKDAAKDLEDFQKALQGFETDSQKAVREMAELRAQFEKFEGQLNADDIRNYNQAIWELTQRIAESEVELSELGKIIESSFNNFFSDIVDGSKSASEAFEDMILDMLNSITKFLFSQQLNNFLDVLSQSGGFWGNLLSPAAASSSAANASVANFRSAPTPGATPGLMMARVMPPQPMMSGVGYNGTRGGGRGLNVNVHNYGSSEVTATEGTDGMGNQTLDIILRDKVKSLVSTGQLDSTFRTAFGIRRRMG